MSNDIDQLKRWICSIVGHKEYKGDWQQLHFCGVGNGEWITPQTPCAIVCYRCGDPLRWLVKEKFLEGKIDEIKINGKVITPNSSDWYFASKDFEPKEDFWVRFKDLPSSRKCPNCGFNGHMMCSGEGTTFTDGPPIVFQRHEPHSVCPECGFGRCSPAVEKIEHIDFRFEKAPFKKAVKQFHEEEIKRYKNRSRHDPS